MTSVDGLRPSTTGPLSVSWRRQIKEFALLRFPPGGTRFSSRLLDPSFQVSMAGILQETSGPPQALLPCHPTTSRPCRARACRTGARGRRGKVTTALHRVAACFQTWNSAPHCHPPPDLDSAPHCLQRPPPCGPCPTFATTSKCKRSSPDLGVPAGTSNR
jgi:hypothetical protein